MAELEPVWCVSHCSAPEQWCATPDAMPRDCLDRFGRRRYASVPTLCGEGAWVIRDSVRRLPTCGECLKMLRARAARKERLAKREKADAAQGEMFEHREGGQ